MIGFSGQFHNIDLILIHFLYFKVEEKHSTEERGAWNRNKKNEWTPVKELVKKKKTKQNRIS